MSSVSSIIFYQCLVHNLVLLSDAGTSVFETFCFRIPDFCIMFVCVNAAPY
jgi:hypothetical protein